MREAEILRKKAELERLEGLRQRANKRVNEISHEIHRLERSSHRRLLLRGGKVLEKAGVLETFDPAELYAVLVENRERICGMVDEEAAYEFDN